MIGYSLLDDTSNGLPDLDAANDEIVVVINASNSTQTLSTGLSGTFAVMADTSPTETASASGGDFSVPALSVGVFTR